MVDTVLSQTSQDTDKGAYQLDWRDVAKIFNALYAKGRGQLNNAIDPRLPSGIALLLEQITPFYRRRVGLYD